METQVTGQSKAQASHEFSRRVLILAAAGGAAFWMLVFVIGFIEVMAFLASSYIGHGRWQVNVLQSVLYLAGIGLSGFSIFKGVKNEFNQ